MSFTESNTIEQMILDAVAKLGGKHWNMRLSGFSL
jgi:hypothetical protein